MTIVKISMRQMKMERWVTRFCIFFLACVNDTLRMIFQDVNEPEGTEKQKKGHKIEGRGRWITCFGFPAMKATRWGPWRKNEVAITIAHINWWIDWATHSFKHKESHFIPSYLVTLAFSWYGWNIHLSCLLPHGYWMKAL